MSLPKLTVTCLELREGRVGSEKRRRLPSERVVKLEEGTVSRVRIHEKHGVEKTLAQAIGVPDRNHFVANSVDDKRRLGDAPEISEARPGHSLPLPEGGHLRRRDVRPGCPVEILLLRD